MARCSTCLMLAGRVGSGIAAELGSMLVSEQIDAMRALGTDPIKKLVTPRIARAGDDGPGADDRSATWPGCWAALRRRIASCTSRRASTSPQSRDAVNFNEILGGLIKPLSSDSSLRSLAVIWV